MRTIHARMITLAAALLAGGAVIAFTQPASACGLHTVAITGNTRVAQAVEAVPTPRVRDQRKPETNASGAAGANATGGAGGTTGSAAGTAGANGSAGAGTGGAGASAGASAGAGAGAGGGASGAGGGGAGGGAGGGGSH